jgi:threonine/homoserine/homoserine lactone efflux protein
LVSFIEIWIVVALLGFSLAVPLGPVNAEMIKQVLSKSSSEKIAWLAAILTGMGAMTGDFLVAFTFLSIGGDILIDFFANPFIRFSLFSINILILGFLGVSALISKPCSMENIEIETNPDKDYSQNKYRKLIRQLITGFLLVITSPWSYAWWSY